MEKQNILTRKSLKRRLSTIMVVYMDGISQKKRVKLNRYMDNKLDDIVDYYMGLLKKDKRKTMILKPLANEPVINEAVQEPQILSA